MDVVVSQFINDATGLSRHEFMPVTLARLTTGVALMSDPSEATQANPHPVSEHRTPREIELDEAGPIGKPGVNVSREELAAKKRGDSGPEHAPPAARSRKRGKRR